MRQKYVDIIKDFINKKPEYKEILDEIKQDTEIVGATEEEFEEAIKEVETTQEEPVGKKAKIKKIASSHPKTFKLSALAISFVILMPFFAIKNKPINNIYCTN